MRDPQTDRKSTCRQVDPGLQPDAWPLKNGVFQENTPLCSGLVPNGNQDKNAVRRIPPFPSRGILVCASGCNPAVDGGTGAMTSGLEDGVEQGRNPFSEE